MTMSYMKTKWLATMLLIALASGTAQAQSISAGSVSVQQQTVTAVSSAQLLALDVTPITLVPAPGAGTAIIVDEVVYNYTFGTTPYTTFSKGGVFYGVPVSISNAAAPNDNGISLLSDSTFTVVSGTYVPLSGIGIYTASVSNNQPVTYGAPSSGLYSPYVGGDGTMTVTVVYRVLTL